MRVKPLSTLSVLLSAVLSVCVVAWAVYWVFPQDLGVDISSAYGLLADHVGGNILTAGIWLIGAGVLTAYWVSRLNGPRTWAWDLPFSPWRTARLSLLAAGTLLISMLYPANVMSTSLERVTPLSDRPHLVDLDLIPVVGLALLLVGVAMVAVDLFARRHGRAIPTDVL